MINLIHVVPHAGTWIEIPGAGRQNPEKTVVPHAGTWIEIPYIITSLLPQSVVPHAGTWIEILDLRTFLTLSPSFPTRERGLKFSFIFITVLPAPCRSPRGNVD